MASGIYKIENNINGKIYIGSAINIASRWRSHISLLNKNKHHSRHLQFAWISHSKENFTFSVIEYCEKEILIEREQYYLDALKPEYNILPIAGSSLGVKLTPEHRNKISKSLIGNKNTLGYKKSPETLAKMRGKEVSQETRDKMSASLKGVKRVPFTQEHKDNLSLAHKGIKQKFRTDKHRAKLSASIKKWWSKRTEKERIINGWLGRKHTTESKAKMSISKKGRKQTQKQKDDKKSAMLAWWNKKKQEVKDAVS